MPMMYLQHPCSGIWTAMKFKVILSQIKIKK